MKVAKLSQCEQDEHFRPTHPSMPLAGI